MTTIGAVRFMMLETLLDFQAQQTAAVMTWFFVKSPNVPTPPKLSLEEVTFLE